MAIRGTPPVSATSATACALKFRDTRFAVNIDTAALLSAKPVAGGINGIQYLHMLCVRECGLLKLIVETILINGSNALKQPKAGVISALQGQPILLELLQMLCNSRFIKLKCSRKLRDSLEFIFAQCSDQTAAISCHRSNHRAFGDVLVFRGS